MSRRIYVASSWRNQTQPEVIEYLRDLGHEVYDFRHPTGGVTGFHWSEIDPGWQAWEPEAYRKALQHPVAVDGFVSDLGAMEWANTCVLVLPCGRSAHAEAGWMAGQGKATYVLMLERQEPELMYRLFWRVLISMDELREALA